MKKEYLSQLNLDTCLKTLFRIFHTYTSATPMRKSYMEYYYLLQLLGIDKILSERDYDFWLTWEEMQ